MSILFAHESVRFDLAFREAFEHGQRLRAARGIGNYVMAGLPARCVTIVCIAMSIKVVYKNGVFVPLGEVKAALDGMQFTAFSDEELAHIRETFGWLKAAEKSFEFWNDTADAVYDEL